MGSLRSDVTFLYAGAFLLALGMSLVNLWEYSFIAFGILILLDAGHAYATLLRTYFRKSELKRSKFYIYAPIIVIAVMFSWSYLGIPFLWRFLLYSTFYHHLKQNYGLFMWYSKLDGIKASTKDKWDVYLMALLPFALFHFREIEYQALYHSSEFFSFGESDTIKILIALYTVYFFFNMFTMYRKMVRKEVGTGLALSYILPACLNYICFLIFKHSYQVYMPLLAFHAISYLSMISLSMEKLNPVKVSSLKIWGTIIFIVVFFVTIEYTVTDYFEVFSSPADLRGNSILSLIVAFTVLPNLMHFMIDGIIWKRENPDFQTILARPQ